ncbi:MAG: ABC transporter permease [Shinella sp.]|nr:MAG: ABC transporter permease [Shinella sp.]
MRRALAPLLLLTLLFACGLWQPWDPDAVNVLARHAAPDIAHPLGTDHLGRDLLSRLMAGGFRTGIVILAVGLLGLTGGALLGTLAAVLGGWREKLILKASQLFIMVPTLIVALTAAAVFGLSPFSAGVALGLAAIGPLALFAHMLTKRVLCQPFIMAADAIGVSSATMLFRHLLPNTLPTLLTYVGNQSGAAAIAYASLAFIGLGADPSLPDWGGMLFEYRMFLFDNPMLIAWPALALGATVFVFNRTFDR